MIHSMTIIQSTVCTVVTSALDLLFVRFCFSFVHLHVYRHYTRVLMSQSVFIYLLYLHPVSQSADFLFLRVDLL